MALLDEKIAALFRKSSPISGAEPAPPIDRPIAEKATSEAVVSEPAGEEANAMRIDDQPTSASQGIMAEQTSSPWVGLDLNTANPPPLGTARHQSQANEINARQSR